MNSRRVEITLSRDLWVLLEKARGHEPRASFIKRALESALGSESGVPGPAQSPEPVRAPVDPVDEFAAGEVMDSPTPRADKLRAVWLADRQAKLNRAKK